MSSRHLALTETTIALAWPLPLIKRHIHTQHTQVAYDITSSVAEAVEQMAALIRLTNFQTFTLYEATRSINFKLSAEPLPEEHLVLDENRCGWLVC